MRYPTERSGATRITPNMRDFSDFIFSLGLVDLPLEGGRFTWSTAQSGSRLDRFLFSPVLETHFSKIVQKRLPRIVSDHFPVLLTCGFMERGKSPFRFENMWLKVDGFVGRVKGWWDSYTFNGSPSFILVQKLKALKLDIQRWNREEFGDINHRKDELMGSIQELDREEDYRPLSTEERSSRTQAKCEVEKLLSLEEISWKQKSRVRWLREGDKNTRFFNNINRLLIAGVETTDPAVIGEGLVSYYKQLFSDDEVRRPMLDGLAFSAIETADSTVLEAPFTEEEVHGVVTDMAGDKAPGPDGFPMAFFQCCWGIVKKDVMELFHHFHTHGSFATSINATFLALIPKKPGASECKDF